PRPPDRSPLTPPRPARGPRQPAQPVREGAQLPWVGKRDHTATDLQAVLTVEGVIRIDRSIPELRAQLALELGDPVLQPFDATGQRLRLSIQFFGEGVQNRRVLRDEIVGAPTGHRLNPP